MATIKSMNKNLQSELDAKMESLKKLISQGIKKGSFSLKGAEDETAYRKTMDVLKEDIKILEEEIYQKLQ